MQILNIYSELLFIYNIYIIMECVNPFHMLLPLVGLF